MTQLHFDGRPNTTPVGYFTYTVQDDHWHWSDGMFDLHGYDPRSTPATTEVILRHKHPDDAARALQVLEEVIETGEPFSCYHRVVDARRQTRYVLAVGRGLFGSHGKVEQVTGFFVDLTDVVGSEPASE